MKKIRTRIHVAADANLTGRASEFPAGEHEAEIKFLDRCEISRPKDAATLLARVRAIQAKVARLPVLDARTPEEIIGYDERGLPR